MFHKRTADTKAAATEAAEADSAATEAADPRRDPVAFYGSVDAALYAVHSGVYAADVEAAGGFEADAAPADGGDA